MEAAPANYLDWQQQAHSFESLAAYVNGFANLTGAGAPERLVAASSGSAAVLREGSPWPQSSVEVWAA